MHCITCNTPTTNPKFCSKSCAAKHNNIGVIRNKPKFRSPCLNCNKRIKGNNQKFCSRNCFNEFTNKAITLRIIKGDSISTPRCIRKHLLKKNTICSECGITTHYNGKPISLQLDHIDGDRSNNSLENCRLLCPNCHSQTPTFGIKNINNPKGIEKRKSRYRRLIKLEPVTGLEPA